LADALQAEDQEAWYLISETELRSIEQYKEASEAEKRNWLLQVQNLRARAGNSETRSARLEAESGNLNRQLAEARELQRRSEQSFNKYEADQLMRLSLKNGEIAYLEDKVATEKLEKEKYKGQATSRLIIIIALGALIVLFIAFKICRFFRLI
jgi:phosphatidate phosphatase APP1